MGGKKAIQEAERAPLKERGADLYSTCYAALACLLAAEGKRLPRQILEPCCGPGAIVLPLRARGFKVVATDLFDWGCPNSTFGQDYDIELLEKVPTGIRGIVTNAPFKIAFKAANAMLRSAPYVALFFRLNFLESEERDGWFSEMGLSRHHIITDRLPMMHRFGWDGARLKNSRTCYSWYVFDRRNGVRKRSWETTQIRWKDAIKAWPMMDGDVPQGVREGELELFRK